MQISQVLRHKGREVATIDGAETVRAALGILAEKGIGAIVVCPHQPANLRLHAEDLEEIRRCRDRMDALRLGAARQGCREIVKGGQGAECRRFPAPIQEVSGRDRALRRIRARFPHHHQTVRIFIGQWV